MTSTPNKRQAPDRRRQTRVRPTPRETAAVVKVPASRRDELGAPAARRDPPPPRLRQGLAEVRGCESVPRTKADVEEGCPSAMYVLGRPGWATQSAARVDF